MKQLPSKGVNFGADNWLAFKKAAVDQITKDVAQKEYTIVVNENHTSKLITREESLLEMAQDSGGGAAAGVIGWEKLMGAIVREMKRVSITSIDTDQITWRENSGKYPDVFYMPGNRNTCGIRRMTCLELRRRAKEVAQRVWGFR
ncbi:unnamed protein product [Heligmosomoides polygyrus]|uniref:Reverse transcriptase domain-containing protein n=1 Tax=Heligmosomoides polygyrus TaxID=6339 RepID=A0A183FNU7_HELPZ|nr:unnamed protein product [Heligmosomoides polygyrus]